MSVRTASDMSHPVGAIPLQFGAVDVGRLVSSTLEPLEREAVAHDVTLTVDSLPGSLSIVADPEKLAWTIATLVGNSHGISVQLTLPLA